MVTTAQERWPVERLLGSAHVLHGTSTCLHSSWHFSMELRDSALFLTTVQLGSFVMTKLSISVALASTAWQVDSAYTALQKMVTLAPLAQLGNILAKGHRSAPRVRSAMAARATATGRPASRGPSPPGARGSAKNAPAASTARQRVTRWPAATAPSHRRGREPRRAVLNAALGCSLKAERASEVAIIAPRAPCAPPSPSLRSAMTLCTLQANPVY